MFRLAGLPRSGDLERELGAAEKKTDYSRWDLLGEHLRQGWVELPGEVQRTQPEAQPNRLQTVEAVGRQPSGEPQPEGLRPTASTGSRPADPGLGTRLLAAQRLGLLVHPFDEAADPAANLYRLALAAHRQWLSERFRAEAERFTGQERDLARRVRDFYLEAARDYAVPADAVQ